MSPLRFEGFGGDEAGMRDADVDAWRNTVVGLVIFCVLVLCGTAVVCSWIISH